MDGRYDIRQINEESTIDNLKAYDASDYVSFGALLPRLSALVHYFICVLLNPMDSSVSRLRLITFHQSNGDTDKVNGCIL